MPHLAYIFERFPSFTQTFCVREVMELERLGVRPVLFSIHDTREESIRHFPPELFQRVHFLPPPDQLVKEVRHWISENRLPQSVVLTLRMWGDLPDKNRVYEAAWIGYKLKSLGPEVKHVHAHFAGMGARACWWLRKFFGLSYSFTVHANDFFCTAEAQTPELPTLFRDASLVVTVSDFMVGCLGKSFPQASARMRRVYNGLDLSPFMEARAKANRSRAAGRILSVGRLIQKKGFDDLISACALLRDRGARFHCDIVGEGPLEGELRAQIAQLGLENEVTLAGARSMAEIVRMLAEETQIFALACKTEEDGGKDNLPTVLMEAMATSLPCVSTRLAGVPEMVQHGVTGLLGEEGQPMEFASLLAQLLQDPVRGESMGRAGLERAKSLFDQRITARRLVRAFAESSGIRFTWPLAMKLRLAGAFLKRTVTRRPELQHKTVKARDKTFDLRQFIAG